MKKIRVLLCMVLCLSLTLVPAHCIWGSEGQTYNPENMSWHYIVYSDETLSDVIEEGTIPSANARYNWSGITLSNGQTMVFTPSGNSSGLYCEANTNIKVSYSLNRSAKHNISVYSSQGNAYSDTTSTPSRSIFFTAKNEGFYKGAIRNISSDPFTILSFSIDF